MRILYRVAGFCLSLLAAFAFVPVAFAHPLGNFTINHYAGLYISRESIAIDFVIDMAEIPAFQEIASFDANGNGQADVPEYSVYHAQKCQSLQTGLSLLANNRPLGLTLESSAVEFPPGAGGLPTLRLMCRFNAPVAGSGTMTRLYFADNTFSERIGWREIVVRAEGVALEGDFTSTSISNRLSTYPQDLLSNPLDQREIALGIGPLPPLKQENPSQPARPPASPAATRSDPFTQLITVQDLTFPTILAALLVSFFWGVLHAMTPGHGKTIVGAYLVGSRGTMRHAVYLGLTTTITHTLGVFALGLITLLAAHFIVPDQLYPWMSLLSGMLVVGIGVKLLADRFRSSGLMARTASSKGNLSSPGRLIPGRMTIRMYRSMDGLDSSQAHIHPHSPVTSHSHGHAHPHHHHDGGDHSHLPPGADGSPVTWRSLLALGISGGLLPCPSALVVLLGAIALNRIGLGLILVLAFSLGLASALTAIGVIFIYAGRLFARVPANARIVRVLPVFSALFVAVIGLGIMIKALAEIGIV